MKEQAKSKVLHIDMKEWTISNEYLISNIELFLYNQNKLIIQSHQKTTSPTVYGNNRAGSIKLKVNE